MLTPHAKRWLAAIGAAALLALAWFLALDDLSRHSDAAARISDLEERLDRVDAELSVLNATLLSLDTPARRGVVK